MDLFAVDFSFNELQFLRQSLDLVTIKGTDAKFLASLQIKIENELVEIERIKAEEEQKKVRDLQQLIEADQSKSSVKK